jgi:hypothetical protein
MNHLNKHAKLLEAIGSIPHKSIPSVIKHLDKDLIKCICELCVNVMNGNLALSKNQYKHLKNHKHVMRKIVDCCTNKKIKYSKAKKILIQQKGGFLPLLLAPLLPLIGKAILGGAVGGLSSLAIKKLSE